MKHLILLLFLVPTVVFGQLYTSPELITTTPAATAVDAFGRQKVSSSYTQFDVKHRYDDDSVNTVEELTSGGTNTFNFNEKLMDMAVTTTVGSKVTYQSRRPAVYQPGKSLTVEMTGVFTDAVNTSIVSCMGLYDDDNGFFFMYRRDSLFAVKRSSTTGSVVDTEVYIDNWNQTSSYTPDPTKSQIIIMDFQFLGVGQVRMGFVDGLNIEWVHHFAHANTIVGQYTQTVCLPIRYEIEQLDGTDDGLLKSICFRAASEDGFAPIGKQFTANTGDQQSDQISIADGVVEPLLCIRTDSLGVVLNLIDKTVVAGTNDNIYIQIDLATSVTGGTWTSVGANSYVSYNVNPTSFVSMEKVWGGYVSNQSRQISYSLKDRVFTGFEVDGTADIIVLSASSISGSAANVFASLVWQEIY